VVSLQVFQPVPFFVTGGKNGEEPGKKRGQGREGKYPTGIDKQTSLG